MTWHKINRYYAILVVFALLLPQVFSGPGMGQQPPGQSMTIQTTAIQAMTVQDMPVSCPMNGMAAGAGACSIAPGCAASIDLSTLWTVVERVVPVATVTLPGNFSMPGSHAFPPGQRPPRLFA